MSIKQIFNLLILSTSFLLSLIKVSGQCSDCTTATNIASMPFTQSNTTCGACTSFTSGDGCTSSYLNGDDFVYTYTPNSTQSMDISLTGTDTWTGFFVMDACPSSGTANCIASSTSSAGNPSLTGISLNSGTTYYIVISTWPSPQCTAFTINASVTSSSVCSDCSNATPITSLPFSQSNTTCGACDNFSSGNGCTSSYLNGDDFVYSFTPSSSSNYQFVLDGTDTWTGVFVMDGCPTSASTNCVGSQTSSSGNPALNGVALTAGQTYYVIISTYPSPQCTPFTISVSEEVPPPGCNGNQAAGNTCSTAIPICDLSGYCGNTSNAYTPDYWTELNSAFCGSIENNSFINFVATSTSVSLDVLVTNCTYSDGIQMMIFENTCSGAVNSFTCLSPMPPSTTTQPISATGLTIGTTYTLMIDGYAGDVCDYQISAGTGVYVPVNAGTDVSICPGGSTTLTATGGDGSYTWNGGQTTASITVSPATTTSYIVSSVSGNPLCGGGTSSDTVVVNVLPSANPSITANSPISGTVGPGTGQTVIICSGGSASLTASGGGTYSWSPTTGLSSGTAATVTASPTSTTTYTVTVDNGSGCTATSTITVQVDPPPTLTVNSPTICYGSSATLTASGTSTYAWSPATGLSGTTGSSVTASPTSTTTYTVTGSTTGCPNATATSTVTVLPQITPNFGVTGNFCALTNSLNFSETSTGESASATYSWTFNGGSPSTSTGATVSGVTWPSAGTYNVTLTVTDGACSQTVTLPITINPQPTVTASGTDPLCNGTTDGTISATASTTGSYSWSSGQTGAGPYSVGAGNYTVTFTDGNGCPATSSVTLTDPPVLAITSSSTNVSCFGACDGTASANNATGGTAPYSYSWSGGLGTSQAATNVCAGSYTVTVTDAHGCTATSSQTITEPTQLTVTATPTNVTCNGACDGSITSSASGGTSPYTYSWNNGLTGQNPTGVCAGSYTVTATDAHGCTATANAPVTQPTPITVTTTSNDASCDAACDGSVSSSASGGTGTLTYNWTGLGAGAGQTSVCAGTYNVTVTDANGCTQTGSATVNQPQPLVLTIAGNDVTCNGTCDGDATATVSGGTTPYSYSWDAAGNFSTTSTATSLCAGTPGLTVTDANSCVVTNTVTIGTPTAITLTQSAVNSTCGSSNGSVSVTASGGAGSYTYSWSNGSGGVVGTTATVGSLPAGTYTVTVTDANGCIQTISSTITDTGGGTATATLNNNISCNGVCDGGATVTMTGGTSPFTYLWSDGETTSTATTLCAGTASVDVTDVNGCIASATVAITQPAVLTSVVSSSSNPLCNLSCDGTATVSVSGGTTSYSYSWSSSASTSSNATDLCAGTETISITDANGCTTSATVTLTEPTALSASIAGTAPLCSGSSDGSANLTVTGGTSPYTYSWNDPGASTSQNLSNLTAGTYTVTITDANNCTTTATVTLTDPTPITLTTSGTDANCGQSDGQVCVTATGGTGAYTYAWDDASSQTTTCASSIPSGTYNVVVTDANNCTQTTAVTIANQPGPTTTASLVSDASGAGLCDGELTTTTTGGTAPYTYAWNDPSSQTTQNATNLCAGNYCVTVTDANNCQITSCATVNEPNAIVITITPTNILCAGNCTGTANTTVTGGVTPYTYSWSSGSTSPNLTGLCAGTYYLTLIDANGVTTTDSVTITEPAPIVISPITATNVSCNGACDGTLSVSATGGSGTLVYTWDNGLGTGTNISNVCAGTYNLTVTDTNSCSATSAATITQPTPLVVTSTTTDANCGQADGQACATITGGTGPYTQSWNDPSNQTTLCASSITSGTYIFSVSDANGCTTADTAIVNDLTGGTAAITINNNVSCNGLCDATATASMTGGTSPYTYTWTSGNTPTSASNSGFCAGPISVTITDANNCSSTINATVTEPVILSLSASGNDASCFGYSDGDVTVTATGGTITTDYTYSWVDQSNNVNVGTSQTVSGLVAATYCVTVTDDNGCSDSACVTIGEPAQITVVTTAANAHCGQSDGSIAVSTVSGGSGMYNSENWTDASSTPVTLTNAVPAGTYTVVVTDNVGCTGTATASVSDLAGPTIAITSQTDALCNGSCDGTADVNVTGGVSPYTYTWSPAPGGGQGTPSLTNLCAGTYSLNLTDVNNCTASISVTIAEPPVVVNNVTSSTDASGYGTCDGTASVIATGGDGNYTYSWFNDCAATTPNGTLSGTSATGLCANTYGIIATDGNGCADTTCVTIIQPGQIYSTLTGTDATCNGTCDGTVTVNATGGVGSFTYEWFSSPSNTSTGQTSVTATGLCAGDYYVVVTDANGIVHTSNLYTINEPTQLSGSVSIISNYNGFDVSCDYNCDGSTEVTASGGTTPYAYSWTDPSSQTTQIATNLCTGPIDVTVTDANGCVITLTTSLSKPPVVGSTISSTDASCYGTCDGTGTVAGAGGVTPYAYQWDDPSLSTTANISNLCAGNYNVIITDANNCKDTNAITINQPVQLVLNSSMNGSNCGQYDGSATVTIVSGVAPFTYQWDANAANQTTPTATNLLAGCYNATVTDANGCTAIENVCVIDLGAPSASLLTQTDVTCNSGCDGFAQISISGGTPPLNYNWYDSTNTPIGQTTASATGLCAGTYTGEMIDSVGCQATVSVTIVQPTALNAIISSSTDVTCFGYCDGNASVVASGGTAPYTYSWNDPSNQTTSTASNLCPGTYTVTVSDANGCNISINVTINEPLQIQLNTTTVNAFCNTGSGSATVSTTNGITPFTYLWDDPNTQVSATAINLTPGTYNVTVTDADGCFISTSATVGNILPSTALISGSNDALCNGSTDGSATVSMSGTGTPPYTFEWFDASGTSYGQDSTTATGLAPGQYYVQVTDVNGCISVSDTTTISQPTPVAVTTTVDNDPSCYGSSDGQASSNTGGGTFPYTYQWDDPLNQNTITASNLSSGTYNITVTDAHNCTGTASVTITDPSPLVLDSTVVNSHCGLSDGSACVITSGATPPYTYSWLSGATNSCQAGIPASTYCVTVTDANGCSDVICIEVSDLNGPSAEITDSSMVTCNGGNNGSATVDMVGGYGFYTVQWDASAASQTTPTASNLTAGAYSVTITDSVGCNASASVFITEPTSIVSIPSTNDANCFGSCDGEAWVNSVGGTPPYSYDWKDGNNISIGTNDSISGLCVGNYTLTLTDANSCPEILNYTIGQPDQVTGSTTVTDVTCNGACDGTATAQGIVGMQPFTYQWDAAAGNQTSATAINLCPGTYTCTITDNSGCTNTVTATITEPTLLQAAINNTGDVTCYGYSDGWAQVDATGGTPNYSYSWDNNAGLNQTATNLLSGTYNVTVTDANGCTTIASTFINQPTALAVTSTTNDVDCNGNCNGTATVNVSGGVGGYTYQWDDPAFSTTSTVAGLCAGNFTALITDINGCQISKNVTINQPTAIGMSVTTTNSNCGQNNGSACINVFGGTTPYVYQWNDPQTQTSACMQNVIANCYQVSVLDGNGCTSDTLICINDVAGPTVTLTSTTDVTCNGDQNGSVSMTVTGGTGSNTIVWYDGAGNQIPAGNGLTNLTNLSGDCYTLQATDAANCVSSDVGCVFEPTPINSAIFIADDATCFGGCNGDATVSVNGGLVATNSSYTYSWNDPSSQTTQQATNLCSGTFTVTVADDNNCTTQSSITINEPLPITINVDNITNVSCYGACDGGISISVTGGTAPYNYNWVPNGLTSSTIGNLCAGTYTIRVTDANGCQEFLDIDITEPTPLSLSSTTIHSTCTSCNGAGTVVPSGGTSPYNYNWYGLGNTPSSQANSGLCPGGFQVQVTDSHGCTEMINDTIIDEPSPVIDSISVVSPLCNGTNTGSATVYASGGTGSYTYQWTDPASQTAQTAVAIPAGNFCVQVADANNCTASQCTNVTQPNPLNGVPDGTTTICYGDSTQIWASGQGGTPPYTINWAVASLNGLSSPITVNPTVTTNYCFTVSDNNGCMTQEPECITITVTPPLSLNLTNDLSICDGLNTDLLATASNGNGGPYSFIWSDENGIGINSTQNGDSSTVNVSPTSPSYYYVELSDGCTIPVTDSVLVSISPNPQLLVVATDSSGCEPFTTEFLANSDIGTSFTFDTNCDGTPESQGSSNIFSYTYENFGIYDVCVSTTSDAGCTTTVSIPQMIQVFQNPVANFTLDPSETSILSPSITAIDNSLGGVYYSWDFGDGAQFSGPIDTTFTADSMFAGTMTDITHFYSDTGYFDITLTITNSNGCTSTYTQTVHIIGDYILFAPSAITPNGDGKNDVFYPRGIGIDPNNYVLYIFDRWGQLIFESHNPSVGWDATYKDKLVQIDVYVWMVKTQDNKGELHEYIGHVTVVR